jgi:hypothetical protein
MRTSDLTCELPSLAFISRSKSDATWLGLRGKRFYLALLSEDLRSRRAKVLLLGLLEREERVNDDRFG